MTQHIASVIIPAAGRGTRLLPATKTTPKELLNIYDQPALQFAIDEAIDLGVQRIVLVIHPDKMGIRHYLTPDRAYIQDLRASGKARLGAALASIEVPDHIEVAYVEQPQPLGLGHAISCAEGLALPGPFGVILPDDLILGTPCLSEMAEHYQSGHMIAALEVQPEDTSSYGIFTVTQPSIGRSVLVSGMVEKPAPGKAPSRLAAVGRYILDPRIFTTLHNVPYGAGGEIQLTDAIARDADHVPLHAFRFSGTRYDCGCHDGLMDAALARQRMVKHAANGAALSTLPMGAKLPPLRPDPTDFYQTR
ncbi:UTP--glucose-1-phosphate uridylyltransferase [Roseinatronobacter thiooxidans]|uniref:UTP--glucose-1-phosphate uridylyltransferase n=1 Tax=Roseinatronobacter thiooxidans TaxID=121821 RepID=A0A2W7QJ40_9RHOB|nr:sugar phosphate nucleotidyltransferase [Roseinatronobacter thiooxidans]PZX41209.1 UTP--glucose-1-phosphate uridylyltransferase [Roseinatronobacter thiooxidans]